MTLILNPKIGLKKLVHSVGIYFLDPFEGISEVYYIHPIYAILLAMFDGEKDYHQILKDFCFLIDMEYNTDNIEQLNKYISIIESNFSNNISILVKKESLKLTKQKPRYQPEDFVMPANNINLDEDQSRFDFPLMMSYNVTTKCKMRCRYCYHPRYAMEEYISLARLNKLFDECVEKGCKYIILCGGDPFDRPDILDILTMLNEKGIFYFISTKSYLDAKTCHVLKEKANPSGIQISLDTSDPKLAAFLTGMDDGFLERTTETIKNLKQQQIPVQIKAVLTSYNIDQLEQFILFCSKIGVDRLKLSQYAHSIWNQDEKLFPTENQLKYANNIIGKYKLSMTTPKIVGGNFRIEIVSNKNNQSDNIFENRDQCSTGRSLLTMLPNGEVIICDHLPYSPEVILGDLRKQSIEELWNSEKLFRFLSPPPRSKYNDNTPCKHCQEEHYKKCHTRYSICLKNSYHYFQDFYSPDIKCKYAEVESFRLT